MKVVEFVCTGNRGRSPMAELLFNEEIKVRGLDGEYFAVSSGTMYQQIVDGQVPYGFKQKMVRTGQERGDVYSTDDSELVDRVLDIDASELEDVIQGEIEDQGGSQTANDLVYLEAIAQDKYGGEEEEYRAFFLELFELAYEGEREQTVVREEVVAVLGMAQSNVAQIERIYSVFPEDQRPFIGTVKDAVGESGDISNAWGQSKDAYAATVLEIKTYISMIVDRLELGQDLG